MSAKSSLRLLQILLYYFNKYTQLTLVSVSICFPNHVITIKKAQRFGIRCKSCPIQPNSETQVYLCLLCTIWYETALVTYQQLKGIR